MSEMKKKPSINKISKKIVENMSALKPIYKRVDKIIEKKKE